MGGEAIARGDVDNLVEIALFPDRPAADIGSLLHTHQRLRLLIARARVKRGTKGVRRELTITSLQRGDLESAERRMGAALARDEVGGCMCEDLVAGPAMHQRC